ncbi:DUF4118 domain-containing protein [Novosphingobium sp. 9]|uniref:DUF4118 domain-containing protein n=1 Tax=Novosphingobium sp. 9 TaxID=2025349 RepID=UPI0021B6E749|nr:DUF4118 domain-containing protein [Novosphingobium sp. 9]
MNDLARHSEPPTAHAKPGAPAHILVAVGENANARDLVRVAHRMADAMQASWSAVHVETPQAARFSVAERERVSAALHLATTLGGHVATLPASSVFDGLRRRVSTTHATQLILARSPRSWWRRLRRDTIVDRLLREAPDITLHVVPAASEPKQTPLHRMPQDMPSARWQGYALSLGLVLAVTLIGWGILSTGNIADLGLLYLLPVMVAATRYGLQVGITTSLASSLIYNFFFLPPTRTFTIEDPRNLLTVLILLAVAVVISQMAARVRDHALQAQGSAAQNSTLAGFAGQLAAIVRIEELATLLCTEIAALLDADTIFLMADETGAGAQPFSRRWSWPTGARLELLDLIAAEWAYQHRLPTGRSSDTVTSSEWLFHAVGSGERPIGVFGIARRDAALPIRADHLPLLHSLLDQAALALERIVLEEEMAQLSQARERERLRHALLSSVSHDLRTPLTTIIGTLAAIRPDEPQQQAQIATARREAGRLHRFVVNLLDMARIEAGAVQVRIEPVALDEALAEALQELRSVLVDQIVLQDMPADTPMVMVDPHLLHLCLTNLIGNAAKYGTEDGPIELRAIRHAHGLDLEITDHGPGIPAGEEIRIFETFARIEGSDRTGGTGLGLAIVHGFAMAMGLSVRAANRIDGSSGARFTLSFPAPLLKEWPQP